MSAERTPLGLEVEAALNEVLSHVRAEAALPCRVAADPPAERIRALRERMGLSRRKFAERFALDARTVHEWEEGRHTPNRAARALLAVIDREPDAVARALAR